MTPPNVTGLLACIRSSSSAFTTELSKNEYSSACVENAHFENRIHDVYELANHTRSKWFEIKDRIDRDYVLLRDYIDMSLILIISCYNLFQDDKEQKPTKLNLPLTHVASILRGTQELLEKGLEIGEQESFQLQQPDLAPQDERRLREMRILRDHFARFPGYLALTLLEVCHTSRPEVFTGAIEFITEYLNEYRHATRMNWDTPQGCKRWQLRSAKETLELCNLRAPHQRRNHHEVLAVQE